MRTRCLLDGPLVALRPAYWDRVWNPKCITRAFAKAWPGTKLRALNAEYYGKAVMDDVNANQLFLTFNAALETGPVSFSFLFSLSSYRLFRLSWRGDVSVKKSCWLTEWYTL